MLVPRAPLCRNSLTLLFQALGLESRPAGDGGERGYGLPDRGYDDSTAVINKVRRRGGNVTVNPKAFMTRCTSLFFYSHAECSERTSRCTSGTFPHCVFLGNAFSLTCVPV